MLIVCLLFVCYRDYKLRCSATVPSLEPECNSPFVSVSVCSNGNGCAIRYACCSTMVSNVCVRRANGSVICFSLTPSPSSYTATTRSPRPSERFLHVYTDFALACGIRSAMLPCSLSHVSWLCCSIDQTLHCWTTQGMDSQLPPSSLLRLSYAHVDIMNGTFCGVLT